MNTRISYLYRDASNYKKYNEVVVEGVFTEDQIRTIISCLNDGEYFIPRQIGFPEVRFGKITEDDHCWFELCEEDFEEVELGSTINLLPDEIVRRFESAKGRWDDTKPLGGVEV